MMLFQSGYCLGCAIGANVDRDVMELGDAEEHKDINCIGCAKDLHDGKS